MVVTYVWKTYSINLWKIIKEKIIYVCVFENMLEKFMINNN